MQLILLKVFGTILFILSATFTYGNIGDSDSLQLVYESRREQIDGRLNVWEIKTPSTQVEKLLFRYHDQDSIPKEIICEIKARNQIISKDSLLTAELFWVLKPFVQWMQYTDPHVRIEPYAVYAEDPKRSEDKANKLTSPAFRLLNINDTLVVQQSIDPEFKCGDQILAINDIPASEYLEYSIDDRSVLPTFLLKNYFFKFFVFDNFKISLCRNGNKMEITTSGTSWSENHFDLVKQRQFYTKIFPNAKTGYFSIAKFYPNNNLLISKLRKAILNSKKQGCNSFILDLRGNPGGNGHAFDKLLSIFINKPIIPYMKSQKIWVTKRDIHDYDFLTDSMVGRFVEMPDKYINKEVTLDRKMYIPGIKYYILMDKDTGSTAAAFCNILHYNAAVQLVGEPLLHNALKYGEVTNGDWVGLTHLRILAFSTVEFDEYTRAVDGVLMPDIPIPYVAADYLSGKDGVLERLLQIIQYNPKN